MCDLIWGNRFVVGIIVYVVDVVVYGNILGFGGIGYWFKLFKVFGYGGVDICFGKFFGC